jgi:hypothetical protein
MLAKKQREKPVNQLLPLFSMRQLDRLSQCFLHQFIHHASQTAPDLSFLRFVQAVPPGQFAGENQR